MEPARLVVGRDRELKVLRRGVTRVERGGGDVIVLEGEPGIGKTRLVDELSEFAIERGLQVLAIRCTELEQHLPFAPLLEALERQGFEAASEVAGVLNAPRPSGEGQAEHRVRILHRAGELIESSCDERGLVVAAEDLHWSDRSTLLLLARLARKSRHLPLLVVCTRRPYPVPSALQALLRDLDALDAERLVLARLEAAEVEQLVAATLESRPGARLLEAVRGAAGNPLFVGEVIAALQEADALITDQGIVDATTTEPVTSLRLAILRRMSYLPEECLETLRLASLLGSEFTLGELAALTAREPSRVAAALGPAFGAGIVHEAGSRLAFRHDLVREAIYGDRPADVRGALHREAADKLRAAGYPALKVAAHLVRADLSGDPDAVGLLRSAAAECAERDPGTAVDLLERAVGLLDQADDEFVAAKAELGTMLMWAGRWNDGHRVAAELGELQPLDASRQMLETLVQAAYVRGVLPAEVFDAVDAAAHEDALEPPERTRLLLAAALAAFLYGDLRRARTVLGETVAASADAGDQLRRCEALTLLAAVSWHEARAQDGLEAASAAADIAKRLSPELAGDVQMPYSLQAMNLALLERLEAAFDASRHGLEQAERTGNVWALAQMHQALGASQFSVGAFDAAEGEFETALSLWGEFEAPQWGAIQQAWLARLAIHRDDLSGARRLLEVAEAEIPPGSRWSPARNVAVLATARALLDEAGGTPRKAFEALERARLAIDRAGALYFHLRLGPDHVRLATSVGEHEAAAAEAATTGAVAEALGTPGARGQALRCRGLAEGSADLLEAAVDAHRRGPYRVEFAGACEDAAGALVVEGRERDAIGPLGEALEVWQAAGAIRDASRVAARLRELGAKPGKRGPRRRDASGWGALTDSERRVVALVKEGLTYGEIGERLYISRRTVETHVARVFDKLGVRSRAELAALLLQQRPGS